MPTSQYSSKCCTRRINVFHVDNIGYCFFHDLLFRSNLQGYDPGLDPCIVVWEIIIELQACFQQVNATPIELR